MEENMFSINENKYTQMTDEKLIENINKDDQTALNCLMGRYNDVVNMKANKFFMVGAEKDDIIQEGMIGLYKAIKSFDKQKQNSFKTFANMCIERQLITAVKNSNRQKHIPLNSSISLNSSSGFVKYISSVLFCSAFSKLLFSKYDFKYLETVTPVFISSTSYSSSSLIISS